MLNDKYVKNYKKKSTNIILIKKDEYVRNF